MLCCDKKQVSEYFILCRSIKNKIQKQTLCQNQYLMYAMYIECANIIVSGVRMYISNL